MIILWHGVGDDNLIQRARIYALHGITGEYTMSDQREDPGRAFLFEKFGCASDGVGRVSEVVDEDGGAAFDLADQQHGRILAV